ncbi:phosphotransferase family protein [Microbacterium sp. B2969]|uniref:Phosphotransferase family protein n=1 Tax=Microbacterium alkaliflavum TaxID=3248839 RepID=A0ABW7Q3E4_9MICO
MDSRTKNRQPAAVIEAMIAAAYGDSEVPARADSIAELERGWFNAVYAVRLRSARRVVLKIGPSPRTPVLTYERRMLSNELAALDVIARSTDVPVPAVEFADTSGAVIDAPWFFMTRIEGENLGALLDGGAVPEPEAEALLREIGATNRALNAIEGPAFGYLTGPAFPTWREAFSAMIADLLADADGARVDLGLSGERIQGVVAAHAGSLDAVRRPRLVEWDLWPGNAIVDGGRITGIVDHERALWGDPLMEAGFLGSAVPIYPGGGAFLRGYGDAGFGVDASTRRLLYSLHLVLIMIIEPAFRGLQDVGQAPWSRGRLAAIVERLENSGRQ